MHRQKHSISITVPPLGIAIFKNITNPNKKEEVVNKTKTASEQPKTAKKACGRKKKTI